MKFEVNKIYIFKLVSSEELVAKVKKVNDDNTIVVSDPTSLAVGQQGLQMIPTLFGADMGETVVINTSSIMMVAEPREDLETGYIQATTGIDMSQKQSKQIITG